MTRVGIAMFFGLALMRTAAADVCVALDETRDTLSPEDRRAVLISLGQAFSKAGAQVTNQNCTTTYTVYNVKLGESITVYVTGPTGNREARASKLDELPLVYEQIAHSLVTGEAMGSGGGSIDRTNATNDQMAPRRAASDNLKFIRLGFGAVTGHKTTTGPAFGIGYRYELDRMGIEVSGFNFITASSEIMTSSGTRTSSGAVTGDIVRLSAFWYQNPLGNDTTFIGGGIGYGLNATCDETQCYSGSGIEGHIIGGYEMLRSSTIRMFGELDITLPFYKSGVTDFFNGTSTAQRYVPSVSLMVGLGWGHSNTVAVVNR
ncbi:MAG: hypothetical protein JWO36_614 [Myxococcales bacterium]|nr:hypothetical protein [Myxococcales bacterium]